MSRGRPAVFAVDDPAVQVVDGGRVFDVARGDPLLGDVAVPALAAPPGEVVARFATISDLHLGEPSFGALPRVRERADGSGHYTVRAAAAALREAVAWGAELIVVKGDITWSAAPAQWQRAVELFSSTPVPVLALVGNHDLLPGGQPARPWLERAGVSAIVDRHEPVASVDLGPLRIVLADSTSTRRSAGAVGPQLREAVAAAARSAPAGGGSLLVMHHPPDRFGVPTRYPPGLARGDGEALFAELGRLAHPPTLVTAGHTHRHRRYRRWGLDVSEVGSTKDFPGVWAGYAVHEGGLRQVVRRTADPGVVAWVDRTGRSCLGMWGRWTPGTLGWRCFSLRWR